jgi:hypothetical protein
MRWIESLRFASQQATWWREERQKAYGSLSIAGEEALRFIRTELSTLVESGDPRNRDDTETRWGELRTELRKAYNQVELFGVDETREAALRIWRTARNGVNDTLRALDANDPPPIPECKKRSELWHRSWVPWAIAILKRAGKICSSSRSHARGCFETLLLQRGHAAPD